jgi:D-sedoheptulose 7-phosphate isomerase
MAVSLRSPVAGGRVGKRRATSSDETAGRLDEIFAEHLAVAAATRHQSLGAIAGLAAHILSAVRSGGKLLVFGNGGSAADAQHFAAELVARFERDREPLAALALTTDPSIMTAVANDYDYGRVFERQVQALCRPDDVVVGISTSGDSENVVRGIRAARSLGGVTWGMTGSRGGRLAKAAEHLLSVPSTETARIQEMHITIIHAASALIDEACGPRGPVPEGLDPRSVRRPSTVSTRPR